MTNSTELYKLLVEASPSEVLQKQIIQSVYQVPWNTRIEEVGTWCFSKSPLKHSRALESGLSGHI